ncbi:MAG: 30S ribosome-binding factor RbfA [Candidatus Moranbacteria bacterium]|nr:30S ribosome-binding factor RbfA [Candidatus Moranbacteria bacterium]
MSNRIEKINELIKRHISEIITREINLKPGVFVTVTKVDTTPDLRYTRVFVSIFPEKETNYVMATFGKEAYSMQGILNKKLSMRPLPRIEFKVDLTEVKADEIEKIIKQL